MLNDYQNEDNSAGGYSGYTLFVSLYLVLMAFFILLNSISEKDVKKEYHALSSLNLVFADKYNTFVMRPGEVQIDNYTAMVDDFFQQIKKTIPNYFEADDITIMHQDEKMLLKIKKNKLFKFASIEFRTGREKVFDDILQISQKFKKKFATNFNIAVSVDKDSFNIEGQKYQEELERLMLVFKRVGSLNNTKYGTILDDGDFLSVEIAINKVV